MPAVSESLHRALKHHQAGELDQAEALYREIIRVDPEHPDALHLLGIAAHQKDDHPRAVDYIRKAIAKEANSALYHSNLGAAYRSMNRLPEAIAAFREAVRLDVALVGARYNLAMALEAVGSLDEAISEYREVLRRDATFLKASNNLASLLSARGRNDEAIACYREAILRSPQSASFRYNLANALCRAGRCEEALIEYRESIRLEPKLAEAHNNLATALNSLGRHDEALAELSRALEIRPDYAEARVNQTTIERARQIASSPAGAATKPAGVAALPVTASASQWCERGSQLQAAHRTEEAADCFRRALELDPNCAAAHFGLGYDLLIAGKHQEAGACYEQGLLIDDTNCAAWNNLGTVATALENWQEAIACYESALGIDAANAKAHFNLGNVYKEIGQPSDASACYRRALYIDPSFADAHINLGIVLAEQGRLKESAESHTRAIELRPDDAEANYDRVLTWLLAGNFEQGWDEYEWRWRHDMKIRDFPFPQWRGPDSSEKNVLVYAEQGVGDEIMFASCVPDVLAVAEHCLIECEPRLVPLFARSFPQAEVVPRSVAIHDAQAYGVNAQIAMGSLPAIFRRSLSAFPQRRSFLAACPSKRARWRERYAKLGNGLKVGIAWRGGSTPSAIRRRSTVLEQWKPVFSVPGVQFVNLQYGDCTAELEGAKNSLGVTIHHWTDADALVDLDDFAAQVAELDLAISIDCSTVHMAGALGVPVWTLLNFAPNWRWMRDCHGSPWYPSMQLARQPERGHWPAVFNGVAAQLSRVAASRISKTTSQRCAALTRIQPPAPPVAESLEAPVRSAPPVAIAGAAADPQAEQERAKYERVWKFGEYRVYSPGAAAIETIGLVPALRSHGVRTILDAGCGTGRLMWRLLNEFPGEFDVHGFDITDNCLDPCFVDIKDRILTIGCLWNPNDFTKVYDAVICCDVMEHIPTDRVAAVLANLRKSTRKFAYFSIAVLPDAFGPKLVGEALHLTVKRPNWWFARLSLAGFKIGGHATAVAGTGTEAQLHVFLTV